MKRNHVLLLTFLLTSICTMGSAQSSEIPEWLKKDWALRTQGNGTWIADNAKFKNKQEPYDAYGLQWTYGLGKNHVKGRMFNIVNGQSVGSTWNFLEYWDPKSKEVKVVQIGSDGTVGHGKIWREKEGRMKEQQSFSSPAGVSFETGHLLWIEEGAQHTQSFLITNGEWNKSRSYVWKKQKTEKEVPEMYKDIAFLIGKWHIDLGESRSAQMTFEWAENRRMIKYSNSFSPKKGTPYITESEGIITFHGVKDKIVFMNTYMGEDDYLISEGVYEVDQQGVIHRKFTCYYQEGEGLPWSDGALAPKGGQSIEFKQIWTPINKNTFKGDFFWKKEGKWVHPIKEYDAEGFSETWRRVE